MRASIAFGFAALTCVYLVGGFTTGAAAAGAAGQASLKNPVPMSPASINAGRLVYAKNCRPCHGLAGKGDGVAPPPGSTPANLVAGKWKHGGTDGDLHKTIMEGVGPDFYMQAWDFKISDTDIWNVINYIRDLGAKASKTPPKS